MRYVSNEASAPYALLVSKEYLSESRGHVDVEAPVLVPVNSDTERPVLQTNNELWRVIGGLRHQNVGIGAGLLMLVVFFHRQQFL
ncbi:hypothetical protein BG011_003364, partial [Mortierella polycephala]